MKWNFTWEVEYEYEDVQYGEGDDAELHQRMTGRVILGVCRSRLNEIDINLGSFGYCYKAPYRKNKNLKNEEMLINKIMNTMNHETLHYVFKKTMPPIRKKIGWFTEFQKRIEQEHFAIAKVL